MIKWSLLLALISSLLVLLLSACDSNPPFNSSDIDQIKLEILNQTKLPDGTAYAIKLENGSNFTIAQNNVFISFPIITPTVSQSNEFKIEAKNNKLEIKPNEEVILNAFAPNGGVEGIQKNDIKNVEFEIVGYIGEVQEQRRFQKRGELAYFE